MTATDAVQPSPSAAGYVKASVLGDLLAGRVAQRADAQALVVPWGERLTWAQLAAVTASVQRGLVIRGVRPGDRVGLMCDNSPRMAAALLAIVGLNAVAVPINTAMVGPGLAFVLDHSEVVHLIGDEIYIERSLSVGGGLGADRCVSTSDSSRVCSWSEAFGAPGDPISEGRASDPAVLIYTSGTTGEAKGVVLSHAAVLAGSRGAAGVMFKATSDDVIYTCLPLFHCAAQQLGLWACLLSGATLVLAPRFSASSFWAQIDEHHVTAFHFIGPMLSVLWQAPPSPADTQHHATKAIGGGPRVAWQEFADRFALQVVECYGTTETFGGCVTHRPGMGRLGSVGMAMPYIEIDIVDEAGLTVMVGDPGEILIRGREQHVLFTEYLKRPDLTAAAVRGGWYHTGDVGSFDADGYLYFHARTKELIRRRGENVSILEVENVLSKHPDVRDCAAAGVASPLGEEDILVSLVPGPSGIDPEELIAFAAEYLPAFALPRYITIQESIPRTATYRVQRHLLAPLVATAYDRERPRT